MDFGSIVESLSSGSGPFSWAGGPVSSACAHNCFEKNHYHHYCGCALHAIDSAFKGSPACSPSAKVKLSGPGGRSGGRMYRSISVQSFGEKKFHSGNMSCNLSGDEPSSPAAFSSKSFSASFSSLAQLGVGSDDLPSAETLTLVEELASFINLMKDEDAAAASRSEDDADEIESDASVSAAAAHEDETSYASSTVSYASQPIGMPIGMPGSSPSVSPKALNGSVTVAKFAPDYVRPLRLSLLEKLAPRPPFGLDAAVKSSYLSGHKKITA